MADAPDVDRVREYFEQADLWTGNHPTAASMLSTLAELMPRATRSVLDIGCGDGAITNHLAVEGLVVGGDISHPALAHVTHPKVVLSAAALPFADASFDVVLATDVLEHLAPQVLELAMAELVRVARVGVMVAVPFREPWSYFTIVCAGCGTRYHAHGHVRRYDLDTLASWPGLRVGSWRLTGPRWAFANDELAMRMRELTATSYDFPLAICPACGAPNDSPSTVPAAERRFEAVQYLRCEHGHDPLPAMSELVALLVKARPGEHAVEEFAEVSAPPNPGRLRIRFDLAHRRDDRENYPEDWYWLQDKDGVVLVFPWRPARVDVELTGDDGLAVFDAVENAYVALTGMQDDDITLGLVRPALGGYLLRSADLDPASSVVDVEFDSRRRSAAEIADLVLGSDAAWRWQLVAQNEAVREQLREVAEERQALAVKYEELYSTLQEVAAAKESLNVLANDLEARRSQLEAELASRRR